MIRFIAAIDSKKGMATDNGIPWLGKIPSDMKNFQAKTLHHTILMGFGTYIELKGPLRDRENFVAKRELTQMRHGFTQVNDARTFLKNSQTDIWVIGGPGLFSETLDLADELYLTKLDGDFNCTKFFPEFEDKFVQTHESTPITENNITYKLTVWRRK